MQRCLLAEKLAAELPVQCKYCGGYFPRKAIEVHHRVICGRRPVSCKFNWLGCNWRGHAKDLGDHLASCEALDQKAGDVVGEVYQRMHEIASGVAVRLHPWRSLLQIMEDRQQLRFGKKMHSGMRMVLVPISFDRIPNDGNETCFRSPMACVPMVGKHSLWLQVSYSGN